MIFFLFVLDTVSAKSGACQRTDWNVIAQENGTLIERYCYNTCMERKAFTNVDVIVLSINNCLIDGVQCARDTLCHKPREFFQCKCRASTYVTIWIIILSSSGGLFIILKFTIYFIYKVRKLLRQVDEDEGTVEKNDKDGHPLKRLGKLTKQLSTKDKKRKRLLLNDLLLKPANV